MTCFFTRLVAVVAPVACLVLGAVSVQADEADIIIQGVSVKERKANGKYWDSDRGKPDLYVTVSSGGTNRTTKTKKNTYKAEFTEKSIRVSPGDRIIVKVIDADIAVDDVVGQYEKVITDAMLRKETVEWSFDQVKILLIKFER